MSLLQPSVIKQHKPNPAIDMHTFDAFVVRILAGAPK